MRQYLVLLVLIMSAGCSAKPEQQLVDEAHNQVRFLLEDPHSAYFMDDPLKIFPEQGVICGEVSSKNGSQQYVYVRGAGATLESDTSHFLAANEKCIQAMELRSRQIQAQTPPFPQTSDAGKVSHHAKRKARKRRG